MSKLSSIHNLEQLSAERRRLEMQAVKQEYALRRDTDSIVYELREMADPYIEVYEQVRTLGKKAHWVFDAAKHVLSLFGCRRKAKSRKSNAKI